MLPSRRAVAVRASVIACMRTGTKDPAGAGFRGERAGCARTGQRVAEISGSAPGQNPGRGGGHTAPGEGARYCGGFTPAFSAWIRSAVSVLSGPTSAAMNT